MFGGLQQLGADQVLLLWPNAAQLVAAVPGEADIALEVLADVAATLAEPRYTQGRPVSLTVLTATGSPQRRDTEPGLPSPGSPVLLGVAIGWAASQGFTVWPVWEPPR